MIERKQVEVEVDCITHSVEGPLDNFIKRLQDILSDYPDAHISYQDSYDDRRDLVIVRFREENDAEYNERIRDEARVQKYRRERDLAEFNRLKALFKDD